MTARYLLDFLIMLPAITFAVIPVNSCLKLSHMKFYVLGIGLLLCASLAGTFACMKYAVRSRAVLAVNILLLAGVYLVFVKESITKKLFCLFNSAMLCEFCAMYTKYITAPYELIEAVNKSLPASYSWVCR